MITTAAIFDHRGTSKKRPGPIEIRVIVNRKPIYINTGIKVNRSEFKFGQIIDRADADKLNERLGIVSRVVADEVNACIAEGREVRTDVIRRKIWQQEAASAGNDFLDWASEQVELMNVKEGTLKHYKTLLRRLREYERLTAWNDISVESIYNFDSWLHKLTSRETEAMRMMGGKRQKISDAGVHNYHKCLKSLLSRAVRFGKLQSNPYDSMRGQFKRGETQRTNYLTEEEMAAFCNLHPIEGTTMAVARDVFVLQMYTGLSYSDIMAFDASEYKMVGGVYVNNGERIKTGVPYVSQLLPPVVEILERYHWQVPHIDNADYNHCLKALGIAAGISTPLHSHMARHTFATYMLRNGVRIENVSRMLGHTNIAVTQRYAKVLAESVHEDFQKIAQLIKTNEK